MNKAKEFQGHVMLSGILYVILGICFTMGHSADAAVYSSGVTNKSQVTDLYREIIIVEDGDSLYTANNFNGGYIGLAGGDDVSGHFVNFSIWDNGSGDLNYVVEGPDETIGGSVERFGNEGTGAKTRTFFRWEFGVYYRTYVKVEHRDGGTLYSGWISRADAAEWYLCGRIFVPNSTNYLGAATLFLETLSDHEGLTRRKCGGKLGWVRDGSGWDSMTTLRWHCQSQHIERAGSEISDNTHFMTFEQNNHSPWYPATSHTLEVGLLTPSPSTAPATIPAYEGAIVNITDVPTEYRIDSTGWTIQYVDSEESSGSAERAIDNDPSTFWHTEWYWNDPPHPHEIQVDLGQTETIGGFVCLPREGAGNGTISQCEFYVSTNGTNWGDPVAEALWTVTGDCKLVTFPTVTARYVRLVALAEINGNPWTSLAELYLYETNMTPAVPDVVGMTESSARAAILAEELTVGDVSYQFDPVVSGGTVIAQSPAAGVELYVGNPVDLVVSAGPATLLDQSFWSLHSVDSQETSGEDGAAVNAFDGNPATFWHTQWSGANPPHPHEIQIDLGGDYYLRGLVYTPRQDSANGRIADYAIYVSDSDSHWGTAVATGTWPNSSADQTVLFDFAEPGRYLRLVALSEVNTNPWTTVAELNIYYADMHDGKDGLEDFATLAANWLLVDCGLCQGADLTGDGSIDTADLAKLVGNWLSDSAF